MARGQASVGNPTFAFGTAESAAVEFVHRVEIGFVTTGLQFECAYVTNNFRAEEKMRGNRYIIDAKTNSHAPAELPQTGMRRTDDTPLQTNLHRESQRQLQIEADPMARTLTTR